MTTESFDHLVAAGPPPQSGQPPAQATTAVEKPTLVLTSASELMVKDIPPIDFLVDGLLPQGLSMLAAPPKYGKSWMALYLCLAVASGENFLGHKTHQANTYYMALEDSERRMKTRLETLLAGAEAPAGCHISYVAPTMDSDLFAQLDLVLKSYPEIKLIIIDTLQKVRGVANWREGAYASDYRELGTLKKFADQHDISILLIHHLRKMIDISDPFQMISGTNGVLGSVDTAMVLSKAARSDDNTTLSIVGRDVDSDDIVLRFDPDSSFKFFRSERGRFGAKRRTKLLLWQPVELNIFATKFYVSPEDFEVFQLFGPATAVSRLLRGVKKCKNLGGNRRKALFRHQKVRMVDIW